MLGLFKVHLSGEMAISKGYTSLKFVIWLIL